jgi:Pyruvate/2-oxoacid:ferredoxin oxidoreductase gamma subunit
MQRLTPEEQAEFKQLKRELLEYHQLGCTHYNPKKVRYNELWDKNFKAFTEGMAHLEKIWKERAQAELN